MLDDQKELEQLIATATLETTAPMDHAINKARLELLERSIKPVREVARGVVEGAQGARYRLGQVYSDYARLVREFNEGGLHSDRRAQLTREIAALIEPAGMTAGEQP